MCYNKGVGDGAKEQQDMDVVALTSVFSVAFFYFIGAIPMGVALQQPLFSVAVVAWLSYTVGVIVIIIIGTPLRESIIRRFQLKIEPNPEQFFWRVWGKYGLIGLSVLSPVLVGSQVGALIGLSLGVAPRRLLIGMSVGVALWCLLISVGVSLGLQVVQG